MDSANILHYVFKISVVRIYTFETQIQVAAFSNFSVVSISTEFSELCVKLYGVYCRTGEINMIVFS